MLAPHGFSKIQIPLWQKISSILEFVTTEFSINTYLEKAPPIILRFKGGPLSSMILRLNKGVRDISLQFTKNSLEFKWLLPFF